MSDAIEPFKVKNCSLAAMATGEYANSLLELRSKLTTIDESSLYYHFWGGRMNPQFVDSEYHNDFASWVHHRLHDPILGERLSIIDPTEFNSLDSLRQIVIETIERRLDDLDSVLWTKREDRFHFICSTIVVFDSSVTISQPKDLTTVVPSLSPGSIFYHFIDARVRTPNKKDDFSTWLSFFGDKYGALIEAIQAIDPYFLSLTQVREELTKVIQSYCEGEKHV